jgi:hypothetical protein
MTSTLDATTLGSRSRRARRRFDRLRGDAVAIPATYTEAVARTR